MQLSTVKEGDIVEADVRGRQFFARVVEREPGAVGIRPITPGITYRSLKARQVVGLYRKSKGSR